MANIIEISNLSKALGSEFTLENINMVLPAGYIMGLIGPNGAGKTTLIRLLLGLLTPGSGSIQIFGKTLEQDAQAIKQQLGVVFDESHYYENISVKKNHDLFCPFYQEWDEQRYQQLVKHFRLPQERKVAELSKGMKMQFALAMALSHNARLLIMDEPTSGLDPLMRRDMLDILQQTIRDKECSVLFSTHITSDLDRVADYITMIVDGKLSLSQTRDEVLEGHMLIKGGAELAQPALKDLLIGLQQGAMGCQALTRQPRQVQQQCRDAIMLEKPTLEDIMIHYAGERRF